MNKFKLLKYWFDMKIREKRLNGLCPAFLYDDKDVIKAQHDYDLAAVKYENYKSKGR